MIVVGVDRAAVAAAVDAAVARAREAAEADGATAAAAAAAQATRRAAVSMFAVIDHSPPLLCEWMPEKAIP